MAKTSRPNQRRKEKTARKIQPTRTQKIRRKKKKSAFRLPEFKINFPEIRFERLGKLTLFRDPDLPAEKGMKKWFYGTALAILALMMAMSLNTGITGDDFMTAWYGDQLFNWYQTGGSDATAFEGEGYRQFMKYQGTVVELLSVATSKALGIHDIDRPPHHMVRHVFIAFFGFLMILYIGKLAAMLGGSRTGIFAMLLAVLTPRLLGHGVMNAVDIPQAAGLIIFAFYAIAMIRKLPALKPGPLIGVALGLLLAIVSNPESLSVILYLGAFLFFAWWCNSFGGKENNRRLAGMSALAFAIPAVAVLALMFPLIPYLLVDPLGHLPEFFNHITTYRSNVGQLFMGDYDLPASISVIYYPIWFIIGNPPAILIGLVLIVWKYRSLTARMGWMPVLILTSLFVVPFLIRTFFDPNRSDGMSNLIYILPPLIVLISLVAREIWESAKSRRLMAAVMALVLLHPLIAIARNPTITYVYFNPLTGGISTAYGNFDLDYWGVSIKNAVKWMEKESILSVDNPDLVTLNSNFLYNASVYTTPFENSLISFNIFEERYNSEWDYGIYLNRFLSPTLVKSDLFPSSKVIGQIEVWGKPVTFIYRDTEKNTARGLAAIEMEEYDDAISIFKTETFDYPGNEVAWLGLSDAHMNNLQYEEGRDAALRALEIDPNEVRALNNIGYMYMRNVQFQEALDYFERSLEIDWEQMFPHYYIALIRLNQELPFEGVVHAEEAVRIQPRFRPASELLRDIYLRTGNTTKARELNTQLEAEPGSQTEAHDHPH